MQIKRSELKMILVEELTPYLSEQTEGGLGEQLVFAEYTSQNFDICPGAVTAFLKLKNIVTEQDEVDLAEAVMEPIDDLLGIEKDSIAKGFATEAELSHMLDLAGDARLKVGRLSAILENDLTADFAFINQHILTVARMLEESKSEV